MSFCVCTCARAHAHTHTHTHMHTDRNIIVYVHMYLISLTFQKKTETKTINSFTQFLTSWGVRIYPGLVLMGLYTCYHPLPFCEWHTSLFTDHRSIQT